MIPTTPFSPPEPEPPTAPPDFPAALWAALPPGAQETLRTWYEEHRAALIHTLYRLLLTPAPGAGQPTGAQLGVRLLILGYLLRVPPLTSPSADSLRRAWHLSNRDFTPQKNHLQRQLRLLNPRLHIPHQEKSRPQHHKKNATRNS